MQLDRLDQKVNVEIPEMMELQENKDPGSSGPSGPPGLMGITGLRGLPGAKGEHGSNGAPGAPRPKGEHGLRGPTGTLGENGVHGNKGEPGPPGPEGSTGMNGKKGEVGPVGNPGNTGSTGEPGPRGVQGTPGVNGLPGIEGSKGEPGLPGVKGDTGPVGEAGKPGTSGKDGIKGEPGLPGRDGRDGQPGIAGLKGEPGAPYVEENFQRSRGKTTHRFNQKAIMDVDDTLMQNESSDGNQTDTKLPASIEPFSEELKYHVGKMHDQFKIRIETDNANKLAKEIRDVYCQLSTMKKNQAVILSQTNGLLAASAIGLPTCSRIQGLGQNMLLQQCEVKTVVLTAIETQCGFHPFFTYASENYTVGMDGWSIHSYSACFWKSHFVNINGNAFAWEHNATNREWIEQNPRQTKSAPFATLPIFQYHVCNLYQ